MKRTLIAVVGGFLGSGKTTAIAAAAHEVIERGRTVGVITNDQGKMLIDTHVMQQNDLPIDEITGGCFCCKFDELATRCVKMFKQTQPDIILAEAVGSCTDISATVYQPLRKYYSNYFDLAPLSIFVEPRMLRAIPERDERCLSDLTRYLFQKQIDEADLIVLNKLDQFTEAECGALKDNLRELACDAESLTMSALTGVGVGDWIDWLMSGRPGGNHILNIDYELYARAEAELGWLNAMIDISAAQEISPRKFAEALVAQIQRKALVNETSIAHLKILVSTSDLSDRIALTDTYGFPNWSNEVVFTDTNTLSLIINARVHSSPAGLADLIKGSIVETAYNFRVNAILQDLECFSPSRPTPQYRFAEFVI